MKARGASDEQSGKGEGANTGSTAAQILSQKYALECQSTRPSHLASPSPRQVIPFGSTHNNNSQVFRTALSNLSRMACPL